MYYGLIIFILAFLVRSLNLMFQDLNVETYIIEDQVMYWEWSLKGAYTSTSEISKSLLTERMPGSFLFFQFLQWITNKNLFLILILQAIIDSLSCVIIYLCTSLINNRYKLYTGLFAAFSPLLIIISSQILSDTIFLFAFVLLLYFLLKFLKTNNYIYIVLSGLTIGVSTFIRAATFPIIFLSLPVIFYLLKFNKNNNGKSILLTVIYLIFAITPIFDRLYDNYVNYDTVSLTSQTGSHAAYWMVPGVLSVDNNYDRESAIIYVNSEIEKLGGLSGDPYKNSKKMTNVALDILSEQNIFKITYAWIRASFINTVVSPILIDSRIRSLEHPSFVNIGNVKIWFKNLLKDKKYFTYLNILIASMFLSLFSLFFFLYGLIILFQNNFKIFFLSSSLIIYFCLITGPTLSPKYCLPYVPIIFYLQAMALERLLIFYNLWKQSKNN